MRVQIQVPAPSYPTTTANVPPIYFVDEGDRGDKPTSDDADFAVELAIEYVLWAEQVYGL